MATWKKTLFITTTTLILGVLSLTEGRSGFTASVLLLLCFVFYELINRRKLLGIVFAFILPLIFVGIVSNQRRMSESMLQGEPRIFLWKSGWNVLSEKPLLGYGINDAQIAFDAERIKNQDATYEVYASRFNHTDSHNQYIQTTMEFGIFGLLILLFLYIFPLFITDRRRKIFAIFTLALCAYQSVFDMFITGPFSLIFCILTIMILRSQTEPGGFDVLNQIRKINLLS
jgi:O-antigen ligase